MEQLDYTKLFEAGARITLSSDIYNDKYISFAWVQDCIKAQEQCESLEIKNVFSDSIEIKGAKHSWLTTLSLINLYQLEPYKENPKILYAFANNQAKQGKKRNVSFPLSMAFNWKLTPEGYDFWRKINNNIDNNSSESKKSIEISKGYQQITQNNNNHEIRLQKQKAIVIRGTRPKGNRICSSKHKASIRSGQISYTACHC